MGADGGTDEDDVGPDEKSHDFRIVECILNAARQQQSGEAVNAATVLEHLVGLVQERPVGHGGVVFGAGTDVVVDHVEEGMEAETDDMQYPDCWEGKRSWSDMLDEEIAAGKDPDEIAGDIQRIIAAKKIKVNC